MKLLLALLLLGLVATCSCAAPAPVQPGYGQIQPWLDETQPVNQQDNQRQRWENHQHGEIQPWIPIPQ